MNSKNILKGAIIALFALQSNRCNQASKAIDNINTVFINNYTINPNPNSLDTVGVIFSIDKLGKIFAVGDLNIKTNSDSVTVPYEMDSTNVSFGVLLNFLKIKNFDSTAKLNVVDTIKVTTNFRIDNGLMTRYDLNLNLLDTFNKVKDLVASNIKFLGLQNNSIYLILETIRSNHVNLENLKASNFNFDAQAKIKQLLDVNPNANVGKSKNNGIKYTSADSRVIFYKLRKIDVNFIQPKGRGDTSRVILNLGDSESRSSIY